MSAWQRWGVVVGAVLGLMVGNGPIMQFTFGVFLLPVSQALGTDRGTISLALLLGLFFTGLMTPFVGHLVDRYGVRRVSIPCIVVFAAGMAAVGLVPTSVGVFILLYALTGIAAAGQTPLPYAKAVSAAFDSRRGLALGISMAGVGLGAALMPQLAQQLVGSIGWRQAYVVLGGLILVIGVPAMLFLVREPARQARGRSAAPVLEGYAVGKALRMPAFLVLALSFFFVALATSGVIAHIIPLLGDRGVSARTATSAISAAGIALIAGRLLAGYMLDRIFGPYVALVFFLIPLAGVVTIAFSSHPGLALAATVMVGLGLGAEVDLIGFLLSRYFGMKSFGALYGYMFAAFMLASGLGPFLMGMSFKNLGSYQPALYGFMVVLAISCALMFRLGPYAFGHKSKD
ncbi:MAG: major facilitator superfamily 1 [Polaromonas sp.]|nr:major facilitator superfamily 1 [Polaromonas sp.]